MPDDVTLPDAVALPPTIGQTFPLERASDVHAAIEAARPSARPCTPTQAAERFAAYADAGATWLVLTTIGDDWHAQWELIAEARHAARLTTDGARCVADVVELLPAFEDVWCALGIVIGALAR